MGWIQYLGSVDHRLEGKFFSEKPAGAYRDALSRWGSREVPVFRREISILATLDRDVWGACSRSGNSDSKHLLVRSGFGCHTGWSGTRPSDCDPLRVRPYVRGCTPTQRKLDTGFTGSVAGAKW